MGGFLSVNDKSDTSVVPTTTMNSYDVSNVSSICFLASCQTQVTGNFLTPSGLVPLERASELEVAMQRRTKKGPLFRPVVKLIVQFSSYTYMANPVLHSDTK